VSVPLPDEQAAIDAAAGPRRRRLIEAAAVLDRLRAENPGVEYVTGFPPEVRGALRQAVLAFRYARGVGFRELLLAAFLAVGLGALWLKPVRLFLCAPQAAGLAQCVVADRMLAVFPRGDQAVAGIAKTEVKQSLTSSTTKDKLGRTSTYTADVEELILTDAGGRRLWSASEDNLIGASLTQVGADIDAIVSGQRKGPVLRIQAFWPVLLMGGAFVLMSFGPLVSQLFLALRDRGLVPQRPYTRFFAWGGFWLSLALCIWALAVVLLGSNPPALVARLAGLG
jgi:hypothetical protein